jgi:hypothetical protein
MVGIKEAEAGESFVVRVFFRKEQKKPAVKYSQRFGTAVVPV